MTTLISLYIIFMTPSYEHLEVVQASPTFYTVEQCQKAGELARNTIVTSRNVSVSYTCVGIEHAD